MITVPITFISGAPELQVRNFDIAGFCFDLEAANEFRVATPRQCVVLGYF